MSERLYDDPRLTKATTEATDPDTGKTKKIRAFPFAATIREELRDAVQRPQTPFYNDVALAIARTLHPTRSIDPQKRRATTARRHLHGVEGGGIAVTERHRP